MTSAYVAFDHDMLHLRLPTGCKLGSRDQSGVLHPSSNNLNIVRYTPFLPLKERTTSLRIP